MKKQLILAMLIASTVISCEKDDSVPKTHEKKVLLTSTSTTFTFDGSTMITEYAYDDDGRIISELEDKGTANEQLITYTYDNKNNIAVQKFPNRGNLRNEYTYDNLNRMISTQRYAENGSNNGKSTYTYLSDRIEEIITNKTGNSAKRTFTYTADKQNIANLKMYYGNGNILMDQTYTYVNIKNPLSIVNPLTPYNVSSFLIEKSVTVDYDDPANPITYTYTNTYIPNVNGYPSSGTETLDGTLQSTTTYEYIIK